MVDWKKERKNFDVTCVRYGYQMRENHKTHYRQVTWLANFTNYSMLIWCDVKRGGGSGSSVYTVVGIF